MVWLLEGRQSPFAQPAEVERSTGYQSVKYWVMEPTRPWPASPEPVCSVSISFRLSDFALIKTFNFPRLLLILFLLSSKRRQQSSFSERRARKPHRTEPYKLNLARRRT